jgi:hypothetical protein
MGVRRRELPRASPNRGSSRFLNELGGGPTKGRCRGRCFSSTRMPELSNPDPGEPWCSKYALQQGPWGVGRQPGRLAGGSDRDACDGPRGVGAHERREARRVAHAPTVVKCLTHPGHSLIVDVIILRDQQLTKMSVRSCNEAEGKRRPRTPTA